MSKTTQKEPRYRLTITGDEALIQQVAAAIELQGRLHLGQLDRAESEIEHGMGSSLYQTHPEGSRTERSAARWREVLGTIQAELRSLERLWQGAAAQDDGTPLRKERREREQLAYSLWKGIPYALAQAKGNPLPDDYGVIRGRVIVEKVEE